MTGAGLCDVIDTDRSSGTECNVFFDLTHCESHGELETVSQGDNGSPVRISCLKMMTLASL